MTYEDDEYDHKDDHEDDDDEDDNEDDEDEGIWVKNGGSVGSIKAQAASRLGEGVKNASQMRK